MEETRGKKIIVFYPSKIIEYTEKKGFITARDLKKDFEYSDEFIAITILSDLERLSILTSKEDDFEPIKEEMRFARKYRLTEQGVKAKQCEEPVVLIMGTFPVFSKLSTELLKEILEVAQARGMELRELIEMAKLRPAEFGEIADTRSVAILSEYSPEELKELAREVKDFF